MNQGLSYKPLFLSDKFFFSEVMEDALFPGFLKRNHVFLSFANLRSNFLLPSLNSTRAVVSGG